MKEFIAGLVLTLVIGGIGIAIEMQEREEVKYINADCNNLIVCLETRLDNIIFRMGMAQTRRDARQVVTHGHFLVNGQRVDIPSYRVKVGDVITIRDKSKNSVKFKEILDKTSGRLSPKWLEVNKDEYTAKVVALPSLEDIDYEVAPHLIVELYSK